MATLTNTKIKDTYDGLLKTTTNDVIGASGVTLIEDGLGNASAISIGRANNGVTITGALTAAGYTYPTSGGTAGQAIVTDGAGNLSFATVATDTPTLQEVTTEGATTTDSITVGGLTASGLSYPSADGTSGQVIGTDGAGNLSFIDGGAGTTPTLEDVVTSAAGANTSSINLVIAGANLGTITNDSNTLFGENALTSHTSGSNNTAIGWEALTSFTGGSDNTSVGKEALHNLNTGNNNTAIGSGALRMGTSQTNNTAVGNNALYNINGSYNVAVGHRAAFERLGGANKTLGDNNVYIGANIDSAAADTDNEIVIGANAVGNGSNTATYGDSNVIGHYFGADLYVNDITIGRGSNSILTNTALGESALSSSVLSGANNVAVGYFAGDDLTTGTRNVFVGSLAAQFLDGNDNVAIGYNAANYVTGGGADKTSGTQNVYVGTSIFSGAAYTINEMVFGYGATGNGSHTATYGNNSITDHIFTSGNVGIGTDAIDGNLHIATAGECKFDLEDTGGQEYRIFTRSSDNIFGIYDKTNTRTWFRHTSDATADNQKLALLETGGNVGIGTNSPATDLEIQSGDGGKLRLTSTQGSWTAGDVISESQTYITDGSGIGARIVTNIKSINETTAVTPSGALVFETSAYNSNVAERMRIDSSGRVGIGTSSFSTTLAVKGGNNIAKYESTSVAVYSEWASSNGTLGYLGSANGIASGGSATDFGLRAENDLIFTSSGNAERMRITSGGDLRFGGNFTSADPIADRVDGLSIGEGAAGRMKIFTTGNDSLLLGRGGTGDVLEFWYNATGTPSRAGVISITSSTTSSFNTSPSDLRLKKNIENWNDSVLNDFKATVPKLFHYNIEEDTDPKTKGYIAQEMIDKFPEAYPKDDDGYHMYNPSGMVVYLIKAVKELTEKVEQLESRLNA